MRAPFPKGGRGRGKGEGEGEGEGKGEGLACFLSIYRRKGQESLDTFLTDDERGKERKNERKK